MISPDVSRDPPAAPPERGWYACPGSVSYDSDTELLLDRIEALEYEREDLSCTLDRLQAAVLEGAEEMLALPVAWLVMDENASIQRLNPAAQTLLTTTRQTPAGGSNLSVHVDARSRAAIRQYLACSSESGPGPLPDICTKPFIRQVQLAGPEPTGRACILSITPLPSLPSAPRNFAVTLTEAAVLHHASHRDEALSEFLAQHAHHLYLRRAEAILNSVDDATAPAQAGDPIPDFLNGRIATEMHLLDLEVLTHQTACSRILPATSRDGQSAEDAAPVVIHKFPIRGLDGKISHVGTIGFPLGNLSAPPETNLAFRGSGATPELDSLTACSTRNAILGTLEAEIARARRAGRTLSIACLDIDSFKGINDGMGHQFGDAVLKTIAARLKTGVEPNGCVGRLSGDEFLVLLPDKDQHVALSMLQGLMDDLRKPIVISGTKLTVTCSMGMASFPTHGDNGVDLMRAADLALYRSKALGRDMLSVFEGGMRAASNRKLKIASALHRAVAREEFHLVFQPQFDMSDGNRCVGVETLLRWTAPNLGEVPPSEFLPLAHSCGLGLSIDLWVLKTALSQKTAWTVADNSPILSINASASSFMSVGFGRNVLSMIRLYRLDPREIQIEVTETTLMQTAETTVDNLRVLREAGVSISVDDFGTGFSSLALIHELMPSELKIDRSFVKKISGGTEVATKPLELILALARTLGMRTVAEGIETQEQFDWLAAQGCDVGQGFYLARPVPGADLAALTSKSPDTPVAVSCLR